MFAIGVALFALASLLVGAAQSCIAGVSGEDAGAASGLVNVAHQLGGSLGLGILVTVFAAADVAGLSPHGMLAHRVSAALTVGTGMLVLALVLLVTLIVRPRSVTTMRRSTLDARRSSPAPPPQRSNRLRAAAPSTEGRTRPERWRSGLA